MGTISQYPPRGERGESKNPVYYMRVHVGAAQKPTRRPDSSD